jgi:PAS domain S-box-containing protein
MHINKDINEVNIELGKIEEMILDSIYDGVLIIDKNSKVIYINSAYTRITGVEYKNIVGKKLTEIRPGARLPNVLITGEKILRALRLEDGIEYMVNMSPIIVNNEIIGGISLVKGISDVYDLTNELNKYKNELKSMENRIKAIQKAKYFFDNIIAEDVISRTTKRLAMRIAEKNTTVLITGESGTGKELYAQAIHNYSPRKNGPFVAVNCAAINDNLLESELFGYQEGSFTGANKEGKIGLFEAANGGTIFLDEISEMDYILQSKLLRTLQENTIRRVGDIKEIPIDVRIVAATNKNLEEMISNNLFREDLYYRIAVFPLELAPLREHKDDILPIARFFLHITENKIKRRIDISEKAQDMLFRYNWPGNIRELINSLEFAVNMMDDYIIDYNHLPVRIQSTCIKESDCNEGEKLSEVVKRAEIKEIKRLLSIYGEDIEGKKKTADILGISLATLYNKMKK